MDNGSDNFFFLKCNIKCSPVSQKALRPFLFPGKEKAASAAALLGLFSISK